MAPASTYTIFRGSVAIAFRSDQMVVRCGRTRWEARRRTRGTRVTTAATTATASTAMITIHTAACFSPPPLDGTWKSPTANGMEIRNSRDFTTQLAVLAMAPALTAAST